MKLASIAIIAAVAASSHALLIDGYSDGAFRADNQTAATYTNTGNTSATVLGGQRVINYTRTSVDQSPIGYDIVVSNTAGSTGLYVSNGAQVDGTLALTYGNRTSNQLNTNLTSTPLIQFGVPFSDMGVPFDVTLFFNGGASSATRSAIATSANNSAQTLSFDFSGVSSALLADVDEIRIFSDFPASADFTIRSVNAVAAPVPEPATLAALGLGAAALLRRRRKA